MSLKRDLRCPQCDHAVVLHVKRVFPRFDGNDGRYSATLALYNKFGIMSTKGEVEAYVCDRCGFIEFYAVSPIEVDGVNVCRLGDAPGTYR